MSARPCQARHHGPLHSRRQYHDPQRNQPARPARSAACGEAEIRSVARRRCAARGCRRWPTSPHYILLKARSISASSSGTATGSRVSCADAMVSTCRPTIVAAVRPSRPTLRSNPNKLLSRLKSGQLGSYFDKPAEQPFLRRAPRFAGCGRLDLNNRAAILRSKKRDGDGVIPG